MARTAMFLRTRSACQASDHPIRDVPLPRISSSVVRRATVLVSPAANRHAEVVSNRNRSSGASAGPANFGLPEHSALTIEGRIERAAGVAGHATGVRDGRERLLRRSNWAGGLLLLAGVFGLLIALLVVLYAL